MTPDGSSFLQDGIRYGGAAVVSQAFYWGKDCAGTIHIRTDRQYAFTMAQGEENFFSREEILALLEAI